MLELLSMFGGLFVWMFEMAKMIFQSEIAFGVFGFLFVAFCTFVKILFCGYDGVCGLDG